MTFDTQAPGGPDDAPSARDNCWRCAPVAGDDAATLIDALLATCGGGLLGIVGIQPGLRDAALARGVPTVMVQVGAAAEAPAAANCKILVAHAEDAGRSHAGAWLGRLASLGARFLCVALPRTSGSGDRDGWLAAAIEAGWRQHPLGQVVAAYDSLDTAVDGGYVLLERVAPHAERHFPLAEVRQTRDLHMDMLREAGRRADAHVARYTLARRFVRAGDRVLDAACGLGYGAAVLHDGSLCESVEGLDMDAWAVDYANAHYATDRPRVRYACGDVTMLGDRADGSVDAVVSFETLEHLSQPAEFVREVARILTPGGRFVCSVPCLWLDEHGRDPNPHHLHVFDRARLEALLAPHFTIEHVYAQTAGGGMKLPHAGRSMRIAGREVTDDDAEWWVVVAMVPVEASRDVPYRDGFLPAGVSRDSPLLGFSRDYRNPWLVRSLVSIGIRSRAAHVLDEISARVLASAPPTSADAGAALCVRAYRQLGDDPDPTAVAAMLDAIDAYTAEVPSNPQVLRWQASLFYVGGLLALGAGRVDDARIRLRACAALDVMPFSVLLDTKVVGAAFLGGWLALQSGDVAEARALWTDGMAKAEQDVRRPWDSLLVERRSPPLFALRELALVVEAAAQCAAGLHLLADAEARPGAVASELWNTTSSRQAAAERHARTLAAGLDHWRDRHDRFVAFADELAAAAIVRGFPLSAPRRVAVFGTGAAGRLALRHVTAQGHHVVAFLDNDARRWHTLVEGVQVRPPDDLASCGATVVVVASEPGEAEIVGQLRARGLRDAVHFASIFDRN